jgi:glutathione S-transferase
VIKLWGRNNSVNVQKVIWCLEELGLLYERIDAGGAFGVVKTAEYSALNPNRLVPAIEQDGMVFWESNSIVRYLCARYSSGVLWLEDPLSRAVGDRWSDWQATNFTPATMPAFWNLVRTPEAERDAEAVKRSCAASDKRLEMLDTHLASHSFVGGETFGFADIILGPAVHRWLHMPVQQQPYPHIRRWYQTISRRPASKNALLLPIT